MLAAAAIEKKAYTAAEVAARTTTGSRPHSETTHAYARKMGDLIHDVVKQGGWSQPQQRSIDIAVEELDLTGSRDFLTTDSATEALQPLLADGARITKVKFSTKSFGRDAALIAAKALQNVGHHLEVADLSDIIAGRPEDEALEVLRIVCEALKSSKLKHLNISDNALGEKGVRACAAALAGQALHGLGLQNIGCSIHACKAVAELLVEAGSLQQLHLYNNMSDNEGARHIASILQRAPLMADFRMASSRVGSDGGIAIIEALAKGTSLAKLDISDNPMTEAIAPALAATLPLHPNLLVLNLNDTGLTDTGITTVCAALQNSAPQLEELHLALNEITPDGASAVATAVQNKARLARLILRENELEDKGTILICRALKRCAALKELDLTQNQIHRAGAVAAAKAVVDKAGFELLGLNENEISDNGLDQVKEILGEASKGLQVLGPLDDNDPDANDEEEDDEEAQDEDEQDALTAAMAATGLN